MSRRKIILTIAFALLGIAVCAALCIAGIHPPKDVVTDLNCPPEFFCDSGENHIDYQTNGSCAAYATAYVLRSLGEQTDGEQIAPEIQRIFGFVPAKSIVCVLEKHGFSAKAYHGDVVTLKQRLADGVPVIAFLSISNDTHYAVVVGYDAQYFYLVDSLTENENAEGNQYNRKLTVEEFEKIWRTDTILPDNVYIVAKRPNGYMVQ